MSAVNLNDTPLHLHEWAELDHIAALEREAQRRGAAKLTAADLDAADARRAGRSMPPGTWHAQATAALRGAHAPAPRLGLWRRLRRTARIAWLHWHISSNEQWLGHAQRDGVLTSANLRMVRQELEALRVELAVEQGAAS